MKSTPFDLPKLTGVLLCLLGAVVLTGWAIGNEVMVRMLPGSVAMAVNTALMFLVVGYCLFLSPQHPNTPLVQKIGAVFLIALSSLILIEHAYDWDAGIDLAALHALVDDGNQRPGRTAPNTSFAFLLAGVILLLRPRLPDSKLFQQVTNVLSITVLIIGGAAALGYLLSLELMYQVASYNRMAAPTALGITLLGAGLRIPHPHINTRTVDIFANEDKRITRLAAVVLTVLAVAAGLTGFAVLRYGFDKSTQENVQETTANNAVVISNTLDRAGELAKWVADRPGLHKQLLSLSASPGDPDALSFAREAGESFSALGFTSIRFFDAQGTLLALSGRGVADQATVLIPLEPAKSNAALYWQDGFVYRSEDKAVESGRVIGKIVTEQRLTSLTTLLTKIQGSGASSDALLCGRDGNSAVCFPSRNLTANARIPILEQSGSPTLPISRALRGEHGAFSGKDFRGVNVVAGYASIKKYGLGWVQKTDTQELYAPMRERLNLLVGLLAIFIVIGTFTLRKRIQPLVSRIVEEQRRMKVILENSNDAFVAIGHNGLITDWNAEAERTFGWSSEEAIGRDLATLIIPEAQRHAHNVGFSRFITTGTGPVINNRIEVSALHKTGKEIPIELSVAAVPYGKGFIANAFLRDITERKRAEKSAIFAEKERLRVTLNSIGDAVITTDTKGHITFLNPVAEVMTGWSSEEAIGLALPAVFHLINEKTDEIAPNPVELVLHNESIVTLEDHTTLIHRGGGRFPIEDSCAPIRDVQGAITGVVLVFHDVSQARKMVEQMTHQATHDSLTGLINRAEFERCVQLALQTGQTQDKQHTLLYLDLDQFKIVNDTCGHVAGDELLRQLAGVLHEKLRRGDIFARLGGDEFGVLLDSCAVEPALQIADVLRQVVSDFHFVWLDKGFTIGVSIGLVTFSNGGITLADILRMADTACYAAKDRGRNRVHVYTADDKDLAQRLGEMSWIGRIQKAMDEQRFVLFSQKILSLDNDPAEGEHYELLLRMWDEDGNLAPPMAFIPAAERYGLMPLLDRWVIDKAFSMHAARHPPGTALGTCAINLSATSICDEHLLAFILDRFEHYKVSPRAICFEITETAAIANLTQAVALIRDLKAIGCRFALDDFGSGMSAFAYLKHLPVDYLKIDGGFVKDMMDDQIDHAMVEAINHIGHVMGIQTIAEFVENDAILVAIRKLKVNFAQGYGVEEPMQTVEPGQLKIEEGM